MWLRGPELRCPPMSPIDPQALVKKTRGRPVSPATGTEAAVPTVCTRRCVSPPDVQPIGRGRPRLRIPGHHIVRRAALSAQDSQWLDQRRQDVYSAANDAEGINAFEEKRPPKFG